MDAAVPIPKGRFQQALVHAVCDDVQACCEAAHRTFDASLCVKKIQQSFTVPLSSSMDVYDPAKAGRCIDAVARVAEACGSIDVTPCCDAFVGTVPAGGQCMNSFDCASGADDFAICQADGHAFNRSEALSATLVDLPASTTEAATWNVVARARPPALRLVTRRMVWCAPLDRRLRPVSLRRLIALRIRREASTSKAGLRN